MVHFFEKLICDKMAAVQIRKYDSSIKNSLVFLSVKKIYNEKKSHDRALDFLVLKKPTKFHFNRCSGS